MPSSLILFSCTIVFIWIWFFFSTRTYNLIISLYPQFCYDTFVKSIWCTLIQNFSQILNSLNKPFQLASVNFIVSIALVHNKLGVMHKLCHEKLTPLCPPCHYSSQKFKCPLKIMSLSLTFFFIQITFYSVSFIMKSC